MNNRWLVHRGYPVSQLRDEIDRAFADSFGDLVGGLPWVNRRSQRWGRKFPAVNVWESETDLYAEAEVPGLSMEDLEILVKGNELTIQGERKHEEQEGVKYHRRERGTGSFCGMVRLPVEVDVDKVEASLEAGVLTVKLPKEAKARARKIEVKARSS